MRYRVTEQMIKDRVDAISVEGQEFKIDRDGYFTAPDHFAKSITHLGIRGAAVAEEDPEIARRADAEAEAKADAETKAKADADAEAKAKADADAAAAARSKK